MATSTADSPSLAERALRRQNPREEPSALDAHAGIRAGGHQQRWSLPRLILLGEALRPLGLSGPPTRTWRRELAGSRPRRIWLTKGCARTRNVMRVPVPPHRARAACGS